MNSRKTITFKKNRLSLKNIGLFLGLFILVAGFIYLTVETATSGAVLSDLERRELSLNERNRELAEELTQASSLHSLDLRVAELGFIKPASILYITGKEEVAKLP